MNQRLILQNAQGESVFCVIDGERSLQEELERVFGIEKGYGLAVEIWDREILIRNYFRADTIASFTLLSASPVCEDVCYRLNPWER